MLPILPPELRKQLQQLTKAEWSRAHRECLKYFDEMFPLGGPLMCSYSAVADLARLAAIIGPSITRLVEAYTAAYRTSPRLHLIQLRFAMLRLTQCAFVSDLDSADLIQMDSLMTPSSN